ncbi:MAG: Replicative DNA helicase [Chlamydiia bacterium]|nr:Replicative DNA helicase [Chlamydiia bacterium]
MAEGASLLRMSTRKGTVGSNPTLSIFIVPMSEEKPTIKVAPNSKESEMMVLGCMLSSINALSIAADQCEPKDFYYTEHQIIFTALKEIYRADKPADILIVTEELKRVGKLEKAGGVGYITTLAQYAGTSAYVEEYVELIQNKSILRKMIEAAKVIEKSALEEPKSVQDALDDAQALLFAISQATNQNEGILLKDILSGLKAESQTPYLKELQQRQEDFQQNGDKTGVLSGIPTGYNDLDNLMQGMNPANLIILAARPSMGKTALALNVAENVCFKSSLPVAVFSLEMTAEELMHRLICSQAEVESEKLLSGSLDGMEYQRVVAAVKRMQDRNLIIDDQPGLKITDVRARARRLKEIYDIQFIIIDYLQLLSGAKSVYNSENRQNEISEISRMLKNLARELKVPILCLSQLSRKVEERQGHRPMLSDLRESGSIEQDADMVMFIFRRDYYNANDKPGLAEVILAKNRHGKVGDVTLTYRKSIVQFGNYIREEDGDPANDEAFAAFTPQ